MYHGNIMNPLKNRNLTKDEIDNDFETSITVDSNNNNLIFTIRVQTRVNYHQTQPIALFSIILQNLKAIIWP